MSSKRERQALLIEILQNKDLRSQDEVALELVGRGVDATQSSVSRDLKELGVIKVDGIYRMPRKEERPWLTLLGAEAVHGALLVLKTAEGQAQVIAVQIDHAKIPEVAGTIAGDDTIFVALRGFGNEEKVMKKIYELLRPALGIAAREKEKEDER